MGRPAGWMRELTGRDPMRSPGRPGIASSTDRVVFWLAIADGYSTTVAAELAGVLEPVGVRWFRDGGGMPTVTFAPLSGRHLSFEEREEIALLRARGIGIRAIARRLGRSPSTVSRELRRIAATRGGKLDAAPIPLPFLNLGPVASVAQHAQIECRRRAGEFTNGPQLSRVASYSWQYSSRMLARALTRRW
jgi:hypothetical protein